MRQLYEQVRVDENLMRFCMECDIKGNRIYSKKVPVICRNRMLLDSLEQGSVGGIRQQVYNRTRAAAIQELARYFNQCRKCGKWVCDDMYDPEKMECTDCTDKE